MHVAMRKKIVPEPVLPEMQGSSPKCALKLATSAQRDVPQAPRCFRRSTPHATGQRLQDANEN